jgi:hypothetical protein
MTNIDYGFRAAVQSYVIIGHSKEARGEINGEEHDQ